VTGQPIAHVYLSQLTLHSADRIVIMDGKNSLFISLQPSLQNENINNDISTQSCDL
jgi:hypothetical protein